MNREEVVQLQKVCFTRVFLAIYYLILIFSLPPLAIITFSILVVSTGAEMYFWKEKRPSTARWCRYVFIADVLFLLFFYISAFIAVLFLTVQDILYYLYAFIWIILGILCCGLELRIKFPEIHMDSQEQEETGGGGNGVLETTGGLRMG